MRRWFFVWLLVAACSDTQAPKSVKALATGRQALQPPLDAVADIFLGQVSGVLNAPDLIDERGLSSPQSVALDSSSAPPRLYVADTGNNRVLGWLDASAFANGAPADRVFGQLDFHVTPCGCSATAMCGPSRVAVDAAGNLFVADTNNNRVLEFNTPFGTGGDTVADRVFGQPNLTSSACNGGTTPSAVSLCRPGGVGVDSAGNLFVSDSSNHRVVEYAAALATDAIADVVLGQPDFSSVGSNRIDARGLASPSGMTVDRSSTPNHLYVSDGANNRVLGWANAQAFATGAPATLVIGQASASGSACNAGGRSASSLCNPAGLAVDASGVLFVADQGNHRVLAYASPFTTDTVADKVWGEPDFASAVCAVTAQGLCNPSGVALKTSGELVIADSGNNRVLRFNGGYAGDTTADLVYGQLDMVSRLAGASQTQLRSPQGVAVDTANNLYVADTYNYRAVVFKAVPDDTTADVLLGQFSWTTSTWYVPVSTTLYQPTSIAIDSANRVWINDNWPRVMGFIDPTTSDTSADWVLGQPNLNSSGACVTPGPSCFISSGLSVACDAAGNVFVADRYGNRVLRFDSPTTTDTVADAVLGQADFAGRGSNWPDATGMQSPMGLTIDRSASPNRLWVADYANHRLLGWPTTALASGQGATKVLGQPNDTQTACNSGGLSASSLCYPVDVAADSAGNLYAADRNNYRVLEYNTPMTSDAVADRVFGQATMTSTGSGVTALALSGPSGVGTSAAGLFVADMWNNRVLEYLAPLTTDSAADAVLGQVRLTTQHANLTDERGLAYPWSVAVDRSVSPNRLYVADGNNNRVLGWSDVSLFTNALPADLVVGQPDFYSYDCAATASASSLCYPSSVAVDSHGRLIVADEGDSRVLIYDSPFTTDTVADTVLGQPNFTTSTWCAAASASTICDTYGVAADEADNVWVADWGFSRVVGYLSPRTTDSVADVVVGQPDFVTTTCTGTMCWPAAVAVDKSVTPGRLYVAWGDANLVKEYDAPFTTDTVADFTLGTGTCSQALTDVCGAYGVEVDGLGNVYVSEYTNSRVSQFNIPRATNNAVIDRVFGSTTGQCNGTVYSPAYIPGVVSASQLCYPAQLAVDSAGSLYVADGNNNRIAIYLANNRPVASNLTLTPTTPHTNDTLLGAYTFTDLDTLIEGPTQIRWYRNGARVAALDNVKQVPPAQTTRDETWYFTVHPHDGIEFGPLAKSPSVVIANTPPVATNPQISPAAPLRGDPLTANYTYADDDGDPELQTEIHWFMNNADQASLQNQHSVPGASVAKGQVWYFTVRPKDGTAFGALITSPVVVVGNTPPVASAAQIAPTSPVAASSLTATYTYVDVDGDAQAGTQVRWFKNGSPQGAYNDALTVAGPLTSNDIWYFTVLPKDGTAFGALVTSTSVVVGSTAPTASNVAIAPAVPTRASALTANYTYTSPDLQAEGASLFQWYRGGVAQPGLANSKTVPSPLTKGEAWHFTVTPCDSRVPALCGPTQTSADVVVANTPPVASAAAVSPSAPMHLDSLSATYTYSDLDGDVETASQVRWYRNGLEQTALANLRTLPVGTASRGEVWYFTVSPGDGSSLGTMVSAPAVTILNTPPAASALVLAPPSPFVTDALTASWVFFDADGDTSVGSEVHWFKNGVEDVSLAQATSVPQNKLNKGAQWYFTVRPKDGLVFGATVTSATVVVANSPPTASNLLVNPSAPLVGQALTLSYSYNDADGDPEAATQLSWLKNGVAQPTLANQVTVPAGSTAKGERWSFTVRPGDGTTVGSPVTSPEVTIANTPPSVSGVAIAPTQPGTNDNLVVSYTYTDADADPESGSEIHWSRNSTLMPAYDGSKTLPFTATTKGQVWQATVRPKDGFDFGAAVTSPPVTIFNTAPTASMVTLTPASPKVTDSLVVTYAYADADSDAEQGTEVRWYKNGVEVVSLYNQLVAPAGTPKAGDTWYVTIHPKDGVDFGPLATSGSVIVGSSAPVATLLAIAPPAPRTDDVLSATYTYTSPDLKAEAGSEFHWFKNGVEVAALLNLRTVPAAQTNRGESWTFTVRPSDGTLFGAVQSSPATVIANTPPAVSAVVVAPAQPRRLDTLRTSYLFTDADADTELDSEIHWYRNGIEQLTLAGSATVPAGTTAKREVWYYLVRPKDGLDFGMPALATPAFILNTPPVANAGPDQTLVPVAAMTHVALDGSGSTDVDNDVLTYVWTEGAATLAASATPAVDLPVGLHTLTLTVSDGDVAPDGGVSSSSDTVLIDIADPKPVATVPADFTAPPGLVSLAGSGADTIGRALVFQWRQVTGDPVVVQDADKPTARFFGLRAGLRTFELVVTAGASPSDPKTVVVTTTNVAPWASVPSRVVVSASADRRLDGSHSDDPNADPLTYAWALTDGDLTLEGPAAAIATATSAVDGRAHVSLTVSDGTLSDTATCEVLVVDRAASHAPVANAGPDGFGDVGAAIPLNAKASYDVDGDALTYSWRAVSGPAVTLSSSSAMAPVFKASGPGTAVFALTVSDGTTSSAEDTVSFDLVDPAVNHRPLARAGPDQTVEVGATVTLDATRSLDPDGDPLTFEWKQVSGVKASFDATKGLPTFSALRPGMLVFTLVASDGRARSAPVTVSVQVTAPGNHAPVAMAGPDARALLGADVQLDGSASTDADGDALTYVWEQLLGPPVPLDPAAASPRFSPPNQGRYRFRLVVWDATTPSFPAEVEVVVSTHGASNSPPVAVPGKDLEVAVGVVAILDGSGSYDPDPGDKLSYQWDVVAFPTGASVVVEGSTTASPRFTPPVAGPYQLRLVVSDGDLFSEPAYVSVLAGSWAKGGGCGCASTDGAPLLLAVAALWLARRRRAARVLAGLVVVLALGAPHLSEAAPAKAKKAKTVKPVKGKGVTKVNVKPRVKDVPPTPETESIPPLVPAEAPLVETPQGYFEQAKRLYLDFELEAVLPKLEFALAAKGVTVEQKLEIFKLMAMTRLAADNTPAAEEAFLKLLELKPEYELTGGISPKVKGTFAAAQKTFRMRQAVKLEHQPPVAAAGRPSTTVDVRVTSGVDRVASMTLHYRVQGGDSYSQLPMATAGASGAFSATVPNLFPGPAGVRTIEYFIRGRDAAGAQLAEVGSETKPLEMKVETLAAGTPVYKSPWLWAGVGVVAAGAVASSFLLRQDAKAPVGTLGVERLR